MRLTTDSRHLQSRKGWQHRGVNLHGWPGSSTLSRAAGHLKSNPRPRTQRLWLLQSVLELQLQRLVFESEGSVSPGVT